MGVGTTWTEGLFSDKPGMEKGPRSGLMEPFPTVRGPNSRAGLALATSPGQGGGTEAALSTQAPLTAQPPGPPVLSAAAAPQHSDRAGFPPGCRHSLRYHLSSGIGLFLIPSCKRALPPQPTRVLASCDVCIHHTCVHIGTSTEVHMNDAPPTPIKK